MGFRRFLAVLSLVVLVVSCTPAPMPKPLSLTPTPAPYPMVITEMARREVTIESEPKAIVPLAPSNTEILYALGLKDKVVGVTEFCNYPPEAQEKPKVGGFSDVNTEKVVELEPDLVLAANIHSPRWCRLLYQ